MLIGLQLATILTVVSIILVWAKPNFIWKVTYALTIAVGVYTDSFELISLMTVLALIVSIRIYSQDKQYSIVGFLSLIILGIVLSLHVIPGFNNHEFLKEISLNEDVAKFSLWYNYDKSLFGIIVLGLVFKPVLISSWRELKELLKTLLPILAVGLPIIYLLALKMNYVSYDSSFNQVFFPWAIKNLFFTVLAEEIIFRGLIQTEFTRRFKFKYGAYLSITLAAILFGLAHYAGGLNYIILSTAAGFIYGYAYHKTKQIEACILAHFCLNSGHFLFFSYPYLI